MSKNNQKSLAAKIATISAISLIIVFSILILITTFFKTIEFTNSFNFLIGFYVISLILLVLIIYNVSKQTLKPLQEIVIATENLSKGNLDIELESNSQDEIGQVATSFNKTVKNLKEIISDMNYLLSEMADCNFTVSSKQETIYVGEFLKVLNSVQRIKTNLNNTLSQIDEASFQVNLGAEQVSSAAQTLSQGAIEQSNSVKNLSDTISKISNHVNLNAENAKTVNTEISNQGNRVNKSNKAMEEMIIAITEISNKSNEIGKIIKVIEDIAFQTNILALNAAVEAARAGEAGKGFAVVADEVRNLAGKSAEAAKNTTMLIEETVEAVEKGTKISSENEQSMTGVVNGANKVIKLINEIAQASESQAVAVLQVTQGTEQVSSFIQNNSVTAQESAAVSQELNAQAEMLRNLVNKFKIDKNNNSDNTNLNNNLEKPLIQTSEAILSNTNSVIDKIEQTDKPKNTEVKPIAPLKTEQLKKDKSFIESTEKKSKQINEQSKSSDIKQSPPKKKKSTINIIPTEKDFEKPTEKKQKEDTFKPIIESPKFEQKITKPKIIEPKKNKSERSTVLKADTPAGTAINDYSDKY